ncbi:MAG: cation:proton antiporter [Bacilli bacterium]|jgi:CPA2 family monovalent cation:H+ antiporter-2|nr:cation:proton antiporter [Bacilli bacterium]MDY0063852.1 cation:proton antiporter [Bacilli bacterium]
MEFETSFLLPVVILLGISMGISVLLSIFKLKFLPAFVDEIIIGIILGGVLTRYFASVEGFNEVIDVLYIIGFSIIMFLSGYDANLSIIRDKQKTTQSHINVGRISIILLGAVYLVSLGGAFLFASHFEHFWLGIILLTITFASTFAGIVAPLINVERLNNTCWGNIMVMFSLISELLSILLLTVFMIAINISINYVWTYAIMIGLFILLYFGLRIQRGRKFEEGMTFLKVQMIVFALVVSVLLSEIGGGEYVLGAFLLGLFMKFVRIEHKYMDHIESLGYGVFIPMFFIIVGMQVNIVNFMENPELILWALGLFATFVIVKIPLMYLTKWYSFRTGLMSMLMASCTLVVTIAVSHIGTKAEIFSHEFGEALVLAGILTTIVAPSIYEIRYAKLYKSLKKKEMGLTYGKNEEPA